MNIYKPDILLIKTDNYDPYFNMALDEYFLTLTENNKINGSLRLYKWKPTAISIGLFFNIKHLNENNIHKDKIIVVRRITGGKALLHKNDLTYSIILKKGIYNLYNKKDYYYFIGNILKNALYNLGIESTINTKVKNKISSPDCFNTVSQYELSTIYGKKLIGSAQKIEKNSMLQHGSFLFNYNPDQIQKYLNSNIDSKLIDNKYNNDLTLKLNHQDYFKDAFEKSFNLIEYKLTDKDLKIINKLIKKKYSNDEWTFKKQL